MSSPTPAPGPTPAPVPRGQVKTSWFSGIQGLGPKPLVATGWFRLWLTNHFSDPANFEDLDLSNRLRWIPGPQTKIVVESVTNWRPELVESHPAIIIKRNDWTRLRLGIDDRMMGTSPIDGKPRFANYWQGSHTLFCIANEGAEAEKLAAEIFRELNQFGKVLRGILCLHRFEVVKVGALRTLQDARQVFVVPIDVAYVYEEAFTINPPNRILSRINIAFFTP